MIGGKDTQLPLDMESGPTQLTRGVLSSAMIFLISGEPEFPYVIQLQKTHISVIIKLKV
jgi:hypothetical protein